MSESVFCCFDVRTGWRHQKFQVGLPVFADWHVYRTVVYCSDVRAGQRQQTLDQPGTESIRLRIIKATLIIA